MGSSDSSKFPPLVPLLLGEKVELSRLSSKEAVGLLRGFFAHLQPCHKYLPAKTFDQLTENVRPILTSRPNTEIDHVFYEPIQTRGFSRREKCVDLAISMGFVDWRLRDAHCESHRDLLWTSGGKLVVVSYYHSNDVGGTVAIDFRAATDDELERVFSSPIDYLNGKRWMEIITNTLAIVGKAVEERRTLVESQETLLASASLMRDQFVVPPAPKRAFRL